MFSAMEAQQDPRVYVQQVCGHRARDFSGGVISSTRPPPTGRRGALTMGDQGYLLGIDGGVSAIPGYEAGERLVGWSADSAALFVAAGELEARVSKIDLANGTRTPWKTATLFLR